MKQRSLNGGQTRPLTEAAKVALWSLAAAPQPRQEFNPGVRDRLTREDLAAEVDLPSPYKSHKGRNCPHLQITDKGRAALSSPDGEKAT